MSTQGNLVFFFLWGQTSPNKGNADDDLVGGFDHFLFFHILGMSSSQLTKLYFSEGWLNQPTNQPVMFFLVKPGLTPPNSWLTHG